jgi:hypothetical protein
MASLVRGLHPGLSNPPVLRLHHGFSNHPVLGLYPDLFDPSEPRTKFWPLSIRS